jgi:hypothetical protein
MISSITNIHVHVPQLGLPGNSPEQIKDTQVPRLKVFMKTIEIGFQIGAYGSKRNESFCITKNSAAVCTDTMEVASTAGCKVQCALGTRAPTWLLVSSHR